MGWAPPQGGATYLSFLRAGNENVNENETGYGNEKNDTGKEFRNENGDERMSLQVGMKR